MSTPLAEAIDKLVRAYIALNGCGDPECETCKVGVAIGIQVLDDAYNAGAKGGLGQGHTHKAKEVNARVAYYTGPRETMDLDTTLRETGRPVDQVFLDPAVKGEESWRILFGGHIQSPSFNSKGAAQAGLDLLRRGDRKPDVTEGALFPRPHTYQAPAYPKDGPCVTCGRRRDTAVHNP